MAAQAALIADTITGMKRALRREREGKYLLDPTFNPERMFSLTSSLSFFARLWPGRSYHAANEPWKQNACKCKVCP
jgi:hypothetical protein